MSSTPSEHSKIYINGSYPIILPYKRALEVALKMSATSPSIYTVVTAYIIVIIQYGKTNTYTCWYDEEDTDPFKDQWEDQDKRIERYGRTNEY